MLQYTGHTPDINISHVLLLGPWSNDINGRDELSKDGLYCHLLSSIQVVCHCVDVGYSEQMGNTFLRELSRAVSRRIIRVQIWLELSSGLG